MLFIINVVMFALFMGAGKLASRNEYLCDRAVQCCWRCRQLYYASDAIDKSLGPYYRIVLETRIIFYNRDLQDVSTFKHYTLFELFDSI